MTDMLTMGGILKAKTALERAGCEPRPAISMSAGDRFMEFLKRNSVLTTMDGEIKFPPGQIGQFAGMPITTNCLVPSDEMWIMQDNAIVQRFKLE